MTAFNGLLAKHFSSLRKCVLLQRRSRWLSTKLTFKPAAYFFRRGRATRGRNFYPPKSPLHYCQRASGIHGLTASCLELDILSWLAPNLHEREREKQGKRDKLLLRITRIGPIFKSARSRDRFSRENESCEQIRARLCATCEFFALGISAGLNLSNFFLRRSTRD